MVFWLLSVNPWGLSCLKIWKPRDCLGWRGDGKAWEEAHLASALRVRAWPPGLFPRAHDSLQCLRLKG